MAAFSDLNVLWTKDDKSLPEKLQMAVKLGYEVVAVNNVIETQTAKGKKNAPILIPPDQVMLDEESLAVLKKDGKKFRQLSRVTAKLTDANHTPSLVCSDGFLAYDITAVEPTTEKLYQMACTTLEVDLISIDLTQKLPFFFKNSSVNRAIERGVHFEICYSPCIRDSTARRNTISNALALMRVCKGQNVILSSQCQKAIELRGPYDVANLGCLFGMTEAQAKAAVSTTVRQVIIHAEARKTAKCVMSVMKQSNLAPKDKWKVSQLQDSESPEQSSDEEEEDVDVTKKEAVPTKKRKTEAQDEGS